MLRSLITTNPHIYASGGSSMPFVSYNPSNPAQGMLRLNGSDLEVFDGNSWSRIFLSDATVGLSGIADSAINWAIKKMEQEKEMEYLASKNQAVKIALENLENAQRQLEITANLARDYDKETTS